MKRARASGGCRIGFGQFRPLFGEREKNLARVLDLIREADADLIVLPELPFTGYYFRSRAEAMAASEAPRRSRMVEALVESCRRRGGHLVTGFAERAGDRCYNSSLLIGPRGILGIYRKVHLFNEEKSWFDPGDRPLSVWKVAGVGVGMMICFDWVFPEAARTLTLRGAQVLAHPSNLVLPGFCQSAMRTRCLENGVFAITANRWGEDRRPQGTLRFTGLSQITGSRGEVLAAGPRARTALKIIEIDPSRTRDKSLTPRNHLLRDRRPEFYAPD